MIIIFNIFGNDIKKIILQKIKGSLPKVLSRLNYKSSNNKNIFLKIAPILNQPNPTLPTYSSSQAHNPHHLN